MITWSNGKSTEEFFGRCAVLYLRGTRTGSRTAGGFCIFVIHKNGIRTCYTRSETDHHHGFDSMTVLLDYCNEYNVYYLEVDENSRNATQKFGGIFLSPLFEGIPASVDNRKNRIQRTLMEALSIYRKEKCRDKN